jgi:U3 small nucleolar RNA-associated protein 10
MLLQTLDTHLKSFANSGDEEISALWLSLVTTLKKTLTYDDGGTLVIICGSAIH